MADAFANAAEARGLLSPPGFMSIHELRWLYETARRLPSGAQVVELGVLWGRSGCTIAAGLADAGLDGRLIGVDLFTGDSSDVEGRENPQQRMATVRSWFARCNLAPPHLLCGNTQDAALLARFAEQGIDWLFVDADHGYDPTARQLDLWVPKVRAGGIVSGHDIGLATVRRAVDERCPTWVRTAGSIWAARQIS